MKYLGYMREDQSNAVYCIFHAVLISCITVLYESNRTVMQLIGQIQNGKVQIQHSYAENYLRNAKYRLT